MTKLWKCTGCGYIHDGAAAPEKCPKCGAPASAFKELTTEEAAKVERSRHTNMLHLKLATLAREMEGICKDGIRDNLDPACVDVFQKTLNHSYEIMKMTMTEMAGHMGKGKWG